MALAAFQSDQQALDFLYGGPVADPQLDIAPEPPVEMDPGPDRLVQAADAAFLNDLDARGEPRLPQEDEDLPQTPRPTLEAEQTSGPGFGSDEEALAFLQGAEQRAPEIKLPAPRPTPKPVTTPEAADGTDVTFDAKGPAFQFTGSLVVDPTSGPEQGLDGMAPVAPRGPMAAAPGVAEPVLNRRPRLVPSEGGQIVFDQSSPERFTQGVEEAFAAGILPQSNYEKIKASEAQIFKVVDDRRKLEEKAQADPRLLAILQGAGRGGAMTVGAAGGAKLLAAGASAAALATVAGAPFAPAAAVVGGVAGAIGGGIAAGVGYDAIYKKLGEHFTEYDDVMKAAELFPMHKAGGEMGMVALALPVSVAQGARGLRTAFQDGGLPQVARTAGTAAGLGAGTGVVAYPIDAAVRGQEITPGGFAAAAGVGALTGGFFLNNRMARAKDVAAVLVKMKAGTPLTAAETKLVWEAQPPISAAIARMDTAGGVRTGPLEVEVPTTSVAGLVPSVGRAAARVPYRVPVMLPAGAVARAKADVPQALPAPGKAAAADVSVPRTAPVNVLPSGTTVIPMPGPAPAAAVAVPRAVSAAMAEPFNWALDTANERGIDLEETETDNWNALLSEHLQIVKSAIDAGEPVSVKAFQVYDLSVPFYDLDPATGTATLNAQTLRDYEEYLGGQDADYRESMADAGAEELLAAVIDLGGLPAPKSGAKRAVWSGELKALYEEAKGAGKGKGGDNQKGVFINKLFRRDGMDLDEMAMALKAKGFRVETEADLIELLGNRLRSGREIFGMATQSMEDVPLEMRGARPQMPGAAETAAATTPAPRVEERPDLTLAPPATVRSGGGTQVPPGAIPVGMAALQTPDWVLARGETSAGRRLIKGVENFRPGQRWGFRSIVDFVNEAVRLEMRRSTTQTSRTHPAHYKPANHVAYTRETQSQINFHEAGHGLEYLLRARLPDVFVPHAAELIALTNRPGSMASDAPASLSPVGQYNYRMGEGVAEWTRLLLTDPATVQNLQVSAAISAAAERFYPGMAKLLRDAARAVNAFQGQDVATRWAMFNAPPNVRPSANELIGAIIRGGESAVNAIASGAPVSSLDRKITRAIIKQRKETETAYKAALTKARLVRSTNLTPLMSAYNMILSIGAETQLAISGTGTSKGLRIVETAGKFRYLTGESWTDLRKKVPASKLAQFDQAAWAQESLNRWENGGLEYPGMREGILPEDLKAIVAMAVQDIPNFTRMYKEQSRFHDLILEVKEAGGLISGMDRARMQGARPGYWPLPRVMTAGRGAAGRGRGDMSAGVYRARGSGEAIRNIDEVTEERTREMFEAYYWNRFGLKLYDNMAAVTKDLSLPAEARILAGSTMVKMKMPMKAAASVSKEEALGWVMKSIGDAYEKVLGFRPEVKAEDVNLSWSFRDVWRPVKPTDVNVVSLLRDGVREYYQLGDPAIFGLFASPQTASKMGKAASWLLGPMTQNWKRNITQGAVFALRNLFRDTFTQTLLNPDPIGWVPGWAHTKGVVNKFTKKYPQVFSEGLLLSRVQPSEQEMLASIKHGAIWQWLSEGFYVSQAKDPVIKTVATVLQPSNWLFPIWKTGDLINLVTGGRTLAAFFETAGREGAAVAALQRGATDEEALAKYWTASGQFNEHSGIADARIAMSIQGFLNPMLQGVRNVGQKLSDPDPAVRGTAWTRLLVMIPVMFGGAAIARYLMMDEEEKERERQRVVDDRLSFMDLAGFSVPFPYGPEGVMASVVYNATMDDLLGRPKVDADRTAIMLLKRIVDPGSLLQFFGPQLATIMEANMNWSTFRQKHIVAPWMVQLPASEQYYSTTPEFYRKVGTMMNYSPAKLQYIVQQALSRQADEAVRLAESIDRGRPMMEMADVPFVGRLFVRDPIGFGSQAVRSVTAVEDRLRLLDERLKAKGWNMLRDPEFPAEDLGSDQLRHLQVQLAYMEDLRKGMGVLSGMQGVAKYYSLKRDFANERNMRTVQTRYAQSLLIGNRGQIAELEKALELLKQVPQGSPDQVAAEYLNRRF